MSIERRLATLEQSRPKPLPKRKPQDLEALIRWYVGQFQFAKGAEIAGISEEQALDKWGDDYRTLMGMVEKQQQECEAYCQAQNAKLPQTATKKEKEEELPPELQYALPKLRYDRRRQRELRKRGKRRGRTAKG